MALVSAQERDYLAEDLAEMMEAKGSFISERIAIILEGCHGRLGLAAAGKLAEECWVRYAASHGGQEANQAKSLPEGPARGL